MKPTLRVCTHFRNGFNASCSGRNSQALLEALPSELARRGLDWEVTTTCCLGHCQQGPNLKASPGGPIMNNCRSAAEVLDRLGVDWPKPIGETEPP